MEKKHKTEYELLRLIANPYRLNQKETHILIDKKDDLLSKYLKERYNVYIHKEYLNEIEQLIDDKINDYLITVKSKEIVRECIHNVLEKFDNQC